MTALDLQTEERLDLAEVALACEVAGLNAAASARGLLVGIPNRRKRCRWKGNTEHGWLTVILQREVRRVLPGSYCAPTLIEPDAEGDWPLCVIPRDADMAFPEGVPMLIYGRTETECWARGMVALYRARLLKGGAW